MTCTCARTDTHTKAKAKRERITVQEVKVNKTCFRYAREKVSGKKQIYLKDEARIIY